MALKKIKHTPMLMRMNFPIPLMKELERALLPAFLIPDLVSLHSFFTDSSIVFISTFFPFIIKRSVVVTAFGIAIQNMKYNKKLTPPRSEERRVGKEL